MSRDFRLSRLLDQVVPFTSRWDKRRPSCALLSRTQQLDLTPILSPTRTCPSAMMVRRRIREQSGWQNSGWGPGAVAAVATKRPAAPDILKAMDSPALFGNWFQGESWNDWRGEDGHGLSPCKSILSKKYNPPDRNGDIATSAIGARRGNFRPDRRVRFADSGEPTCRSLWVRISSELQRC